MTDFTGFDGWLTIKDEQHALDVNQLEKPFTVSEFIEQCNCSLTTDYENILIEGEVASFKVNQGKWVFFDLKEDDTSLNCFLPLSQLTVGIKDGMKVQVQATPKLTNWGRFSLTVRKIMPKGEGSIKKSFELLKKKLAAEGLFDLARKRPLPASLQQIAVISSTGAAGYADFIKILNERWGGLKVYVAHTQVQGIGAPEQMIRALNYINQHLEVDVIALIRGGGSADDLAVYNDENLVRAIASSRTPTITGIGHEVDQSLADLAADLRASTPSNAAEYLTPDRQAEMIKLRNQLRSLRELTLREIANRRAQGRRQLEEVKQKMLSAVELSLNHLHQEQKMIAELNPGKVLERGYAMVRGEVKVGNELEIERIHDQIRVKVLKVVDKTTGPG